MTDGGPRVLSDVAAMAADRWPDRPALTQGATTLSYGEVWRRSAAVAAALRRRGVGRGDRVVIQTADITGSVPALFGTALAGGIYVPVSASLSAYAATHVLRDCAPALVVCPDGDELGRCADDLAIRRVEPGSLADAHGNGEAAAALSIDPVGILYTSGSTGRPKGVVSSHSNVLFAVDAIARRLSLRPADVIGCVLPADFDYGLYQIFLAATCGAHVVWGTSADAGPGLLSFLARNAVTVLPAVPDLVYSLVTLTAAGRGAARELRMVTNTGAALSGELCRRLRKLYPAAGIYPMFGLTECKRVSILLPSELDTRPGSVGRPLDDTQCLIVDPQTGCPCPAGVIGELVVRGPHVMQGYWGDADATSLRFRPWGPLGQRALFTGDLCWLDDCGYLYFAGRADDVFKAHGYRVSAVEISLAAADIPEVAQAHCLPPTSQRPSILAVVTGHDLGHVREQLAARLEPYKMPELMVRVGSLPRQPNGKVNGQALAAAVADGGAADGGRAVAGREHDR
jgi:acyl-CoA synthetase (AMP-forming)/AMP-acid ligase II